jgi:nucleotide-binding universal stress UspA family protein
MPSYSRRSGIRHPRRLFRKHQQISRKLELQGPPVEMILAQAENYRTDLIVLGSHNHGFFDHLFTGSVVDGILQRAKCPVLVVPLHD